MTFAARIPTTSTGAVGSSSSSVDIQNSVSPSSVVWMGRMHRARPSCAMPATFAAWAFVSFTLVAMMPMVVFLPPKEREDAALMTPSSVLAKVPSGFLVPAMILPFSQTSPKALTAMRAATNWHTHYQIQANNTYISPTNSNPI